MASMESKWILGLKLDLFQKNNGFYGVKVDNIVIGSWILGSKLDLGPKVGSDKVGLGPKVGSDREKPWLLWSQSGSWAPSWI